MSESETETRTYNKADRTIGRYVELFSIRRLRPPHVQECGPCESVVTMGCVDEVGRYCLLADTAVISLFAEGLLTERPGFTPDKHTSAISTRRLMNVEREHS
jgi:hypothetical protein